MRKRTWTCPFGREPFTTKREAEKASPVGQAERCERCKQFHPKTGRKKGRRG